MHINLFCVFLTSPLLASWSTYTIQISVLRGKLSRIFWKISLALSGSPILNSSCPNLDEMSTWCFVSRFCRLRCSVNRHGRPVRRRCSVSTTLTSMHTNGKFALMCMYENC